MHPCSIMYIEQSRLNLKTSRMPSQITCNNNEEKRSSILSTYHLVPKFICLKLLIKNKLAFAFRLTSRMPNSFKTQMLSKKVINLQHFYLFMRKQRTEEVSLWFLLNANKCKDAFPYNMLFNVVCVCVCVCVYL